MSQRYSVPGIVQHRRKVSHWGPVGVPIERWISSHPRKELINRIQLMLRRRQPMVLQTPRWSVSDVFLLDLFKEKKQYFVPRIRLSSQNSLSESWMMVAQMINEYSEEEEAKTLLVMTERNGFRWYLKQFFKQLHLRGVPPKAIIVDKVEHWPLSIVEDFQLAWQEFFTSLPEVEHIPLVISGAVEGGIFHNFVWLEDYGLTEAEELLLGNGIEDKELGVLSGGVPALIYALLDAEEPSIDSWSSILEEARKVRDLLFAQKSYYDRLMRLSEGREEPSLLPVDKVLMQAGLVKMSGKGNRGSTSLRAPVFSRIIKGH